MGYTTDFTGRLRFSRRLKPEEHAELMKLADERHGGNIDVEGGYPGFYCQWVPTDDRWFLQWDGGEKFYHYVEWLNFIIDRYLEPWGVTVTGTLRWKGEERDDRGKIRADASVLTITKAEKKKRT